MLPHLGATFVLLVEYICAPLVCHHDYDTQAKKLIPNYGSPPRPRSSSEDSTNLPTTSRYRMAYESWSHGSWLFNRPNVAEAVLQTPLSFIHPLIK